MITNEHPLQPGDAAPDFALPAVNGEGLVSLSDYRGKRAVLIGLYRGLHCPFCRRQITRLSATQKLLTQVGLRRLERFLNVRLTINGELSEPVNPIAAQEILNAGDGFAMTEADQHSVTAHQSQRTGHFLIDLEGTIRWSAAEAPDGPEQIGAFVSDDEIIAAARESRR